MSFRQICGIIIAAPIAVIIIAFILANRALTTLNFNIFSALWSGSETAGLTAPLFVWLFLALAAGIIIGFIASAPRLISRRRQIARLEQENGRLKADLAAGAAKAAAAEPAEMAAHY